MEWSESKLDNAKKVMSLVQKITQLRFDTECFIRSIDFIENQLPNRGTQASDRDVAYVVTLKELLIADIEELQRRLKRF